MEVTEVIELYKKAKVNPPKWAEDKLNEIKKKEYEEKMAELRA